MRNYQVINICALYPQLVQTFQQQGRRAGGTGFKKGNFFTNQHERRQKQLDAQAR
jgi:hypothetical protein